MYPVFEFQAGLWSLNQYFSILPCPAADSACCADTGNKVVPKCQDYDERTITDGCRAVQKTCEKPGKCMIWFSLFAFAASVPLYVMCCCSSKPVRLTCQHFCKLHIVHARIPWYCISLASAHFKIANYCFPVRVKNVAWGLCRTMRKEVEIRISVQG
jgi:hypothetical protein